MIESLEERKSKLLRYLEEEYKDRNPEKWWHNKPPVYRTTKDFGYPPYPGTWPEERVIIKNDLAGAVFFTALLFFMTLNCWRPWDDEPKDYFPVVFMLLVLGFSISRVFDRSPRIILSAEGIWTKDWGYTIKWDSIAASYIEADANGDSTTYTLILYYYNEQADEFYKIGYKLCSLNISNETLAGLIEHWRNKMQA